MQIIKTIQETKAVLKKYRAAGKTIGLVPTMGYLHEGHGSLIVRSVSENDITVVSIFVNPIQFAPGEDLEAYPRDLEKDAAYCTQLGADIIFHPDPEEMYGPGFSTYVDMNVLTEDLCGKSRPAHFRGVCTVVNKLFNIVQPDRAYFGEKDAQQLAIIRHMVEDLNMNLTVVGCPIIREEDGLAKSSRNTYLSVKERQAALCLSRGLKAGRALLDAGETDADRILAAVRAVIEAEPLARIDYVKAVDGLSMQPVDVIRTPALIAIAVYIGKTRLIDNFHV